MCEKAKEIQREYFYQFQSTSGDWIYCKENNKIVVLYFNREHGSPPAKYQDIKTAIWLPTQDQLQEMSNMTWWDFDKRCNEIRKCFLEDPLSEWEMETKEQTGICVVMEKRFNKFWDNEKEVWI